MATNDSGSGKQGGSKEAPPVLFVRRESLKKFKGEIRIETHTLLTKYVAYHQKFDGTKPLETELIDRALVLAFERDVPFQKFLGNGGAKAAAPDVSEGGKGGGSEALS